MDRNHALLSPTLRAQAPPFRTGGRAQARLGCARAFPGSGLTYKKGESSGGAITMIKFFISDLEKNIVEAETVKKVEWNSALSSRTSAMRAWHEATE